VRPVPFDARPLAIVQTMRGHLHRTTWGQIVKSRHAR